ncbi:MAG: hypothetical protein Q9174_005290 [Haloplaca sp. 1 TL-2023]
MVSSILAEISRLDLSEADTSSPISITNVKHLASYNWIEAPTPTIAVPGSPNLWSPPSGPRKLKADTGHLFIAQNAARHPDSPLEPLFRALYLAEPSFDIGSIDVVADRNNIRALLSFVDPNSMKEKKDFTMSVETVKESAIFSREETKVEEFLGPGDFRGFGHNFEEAFTTSQIKGSTGHHRIISYRFGHLNFVVRHETDGYVAAKSGPSASKIHDTASDDLSNLLGSLALNPSTKVSTFTPPGSKMTIKQEGHPVPLDLNLEIKTKSARNPFEMNHIIPQLWASHTLKLVKAPHMSGTFQHPQVEDIAVEIQKWEERNQTTLRKLAALIKRIVKVTKENGGRATVRHDLCKGKLFICEGNGGKKMLPEDIYLKWDHSTNSTDAQSIQGAQGDTAGKTGVETSEKGKEKATFEGIEKGTQDSSSEDTS